MNVPMNYIGLGFNCLFLLLCLCGYFYVLNKTSKKWVFLILFASAWFVSAVSYICLISGIPTVDWSITSLRTLSYLLFTATIFTAIAELTKLGKKKK